MLYGNWPAGLCFHDDILPPFLCTFPRVNLGQASALFFCVIILLRDNFVELYYLC